MYLYTPQKDRYQVKHYVYELVAALELERKKLCGKVLCSKASLKRHIADKHAERQEEYRCIICERVYCSRNSLMTHIYTYHKSRPGELDMKDVKFF
uniref:C2H2-type domain-containing protein n=1 Tax=Anopheles funestus TaxID=62324 RepID=A0A182RFT3_ANOFN